MNDHFVAQQLKKLSQITPNADWVSQQRQVIKAQVYNGQQPSGVAFNHWTDLWLSFRYAFNQPGVVVSAILAVVLLGGGTTSYLAGRTAQPGDSLYIARQINERAQLLAVSFDRAEQNKLKLAIASQRVTEMAAVDTLGNQQQAANISREFKQTVSEVKDKLAQAATKAAAVAVVQTGQVMETTPIVNPTDADGTFSVATGKDKTGRLEVSQTVVAPVATQTPSQILEEAEQLFDQQQYSATIDKLQAASDLLDSVANAK